ncbi:MULTISPECIES: adenosylcobinamide-GDP ribazoletransferase [Bradyrhizobium]|uniref:Adenosylcobinamide-GDP ribazoletransferase n=1 Tax=Bradyrhizobium diazoefficiens (strain JCM 10833 / BCRC 13528 / IAM 13628 / NBRC 14792 / USDA 110) TaxID=224911 RepID=COBS_BRADU|nr:adenosylcobinamide-GDP ribazoletransferase [Bradyrhizobium diazoefficiens]Q89Q75.1 RecName: Full=Adenosylcobinamide-GDP ribazoletransferase; AltName: Full=Cobalamin synthase; AltName: Full=Cobalamin-5'-phosphate synthase [Bradyrhizobium diazoefficiens USDA 110]MBP1066796.1 adenosylcobinamide-GDP ribazoletransferase [Bradyrhizobium japonicum]AND88685.1 cobalamin synthase [Bradyrhizobium diazoefficiens USDA 110]AWO90241.1 adenosylcobinamide-GDP ribazoletransferase [Bradyrhizobium diazoefficien
MIPGTETIRNVIADLRIAASFVTLLPVGSSKPAADGAIARATWALPVAGLLVGLAGALVYKISSRLGLTPNLAALLALATTALITGALHEDGLADTADGLGGGRTRERKLEIMRDSRIGTYGVCALILSFGLRWSALAAIANPWLVTLALCAAHCAARAGVPAFMSLVPPARPDGLSASAGAPPGRSVAIAFAVGTLVLTLALGPGKALVGLILLSLAGLILARLAIRQIGGQTGDILGAFEQTGEIVILLVAAAFQMGR